MSRQHRPLTKYTAENRKISIYLPHPIREAVEHQALRTDRSVSWMLQRAWKIAAREIEKLPGVPSIEVKR